MKRLYHKRFNNKIYIVNGIKYTSIWKLRDDLHTSMKRIKVYLHKGAKTFEKGKHIYTFTVPAKEKREIPYKIGDIIGNKEIIGIRSLNETNSELMLKLKCLNCGNIREYSSKTILNLNKTKYCIVCKSKLLTKKIIYKGKEYDSLTEVSKVSGMTLSSVSRHLTRNGNLDTLGKYREDKESRLLNLCINNKKVIKVNGNKVTIKCLKCGEEYTISKSYASRYMKEGKCKNCESDNRTIYHNIEYKGQIYKTIKELCEKTGEKVGTVGLHLRKYGYLSKLHSSRKHNNYVVGMIIANKQILKISKNSFKVKCLNCGKVYKLTRLSIYTMKKDRKTCRYCNIRNRRKINNNFGYRIEFRGKIYPSLNALARAFNVSPGKVIGQYQRHNGDLSKLRV